LEIEKCTREVCRYNGDCVYLGLRKKYHCECDSGYAGRNCTFSNATALIHLQDMNYLLVQRYLQTVNYPEYQMEFMTLIAKWPEVLKLDTVDFLFQVFSDKLITEKVELLSEQKT